MLRGCLACLLFLLASTAIAKDDPPPPSLPLPPGTPGLMLVDLEKNFVEYNPARDDPSLGLLPLYMLAKAAQDDEARVSVVRESVAAAKLDEYFQQVIRERLAALGPTDAITVADKPWSAEEASSLWMKWWAAPSRGSSFRRWKRACARP